jgi:hypothetical protein
MYTARWPPLSGNSNISDTAYDRFVRGEDARLETGRSAGWSSSLVRGSVSSATFHHIFTMVSLPRPVFQFHSKRGLLSIPTLALVP